LANIAVESPKGWKSVLGAVQPRDDLGIDYDEQNAQQPSAAEPKGSNYRD
jgi:hypothetical protein